MNHMRSLIKFKPTAPLFISLMLVWFALSPTAQGQTPTPDMAVLGFNTADGLNALTSVTSGIYNSAFGFSALKADTTGSFNTAVGGQALKFLTAGTQNTAVGVNALAFDTTAIKNTAVGQGALENNNANFNVATGYRALNHNTTGIGNTATGFQALDSNTNGFGNVACGFAALGLNSTGHGNTALGSEAGINITAGNDNVDIANQGIAGDSNTIRIGTAGFQTKTFVAGIFGTVVTGSQVGVTSTGQLGVLATSSERFKDAIKPMDKASEAILALKPVTFHYKKELDPDGIPQFGLVAEEVEKVDPDLVARDANGKVYTVRYEAVNAMLLNEFLKAHRRIEEQDKRIDQLTAALKEQAALIQKVSDRIKLSKPAPQTVLNNQ
jgi:Chaperone of endosialidase